MVSKHIKTGKIGEEIANRFLMKHNFSILDRNTNKKWGEIDIIAENKDFLYFIEVKTLSFHSVSHETFEDVFPEEQITPKKAKRLRRAVELYKLENHTKRDICFGVIAVILDQVNSKGRVRFYPDIVL